MVTREQFQRELEELNEETITMIHKAGHALNKSIETLFMPDNELANQIISEDHNIDKLEQEIDNKSILLIAKQQPVATDLRRVIAALKIVTDIERMADNAKNVARSSLLLSKSSLSLPEEIKTMGEISQSMLSKAVKAFNQEDAGIAETIVSMDNEVDKLNQTIISKMLGETATHPDKVQYVMQVVFCGRYIERYADHIVNIADNILYIVKGKKAAV